MIFIYVYNIESRYNVDKYNPAILPVSMEVLAPYVWTQSLVHLLYEQNFSEDILFCGGYVKKIQWI